MSVKFDGVAFPLFDHNNFQFHSRCNVSLVISKMNRKLTTRASVLLFADIILLLLRDDCSDIRDTISQVVQCLRCESSSCESLVLPSLAEEHFIDWLDKQFRLFTSEQPWTVWIDLIKMQLDRNVTENEEIATDEVFDKSEANVFGEVVLVCKTLMQKVQQSVTTSASDVKETLSSIESDWPELSD